MHECIPYIFVRKILRILCHKTSIPNYNLHVKCKSAMRLITAHCSQWWLTQENEHTFYTLYHATLQKKGYFTFKQTVELIWWLQKSCFFCQLNCDKNAAWVLSITTELKWPHTAGILYLSVILWLVFDVYFILFTQSQDGEEKKSLR